MSPLFSLLMVEGGYEPWKEVTNNRSPYIRPASVTLKMPDHSLVSERIAP